MSLILGIDFQVWTWQPNWALAPVDRWRFRTNVLLAYRGQEQRRALRIGPRHEVEFAVEVAGDDRRQLEAALYAWGRRRWAVPMWFDGLELDAVLPAGAAAIPADPRNRYFESGGLALLIADSSRVFEVVSISGLTDSEISLSGVTARSWSAGTRLYPLRIGFIENNVSLPRWTGEHASSRFVFRMEEPASWSDTIDDPIYRGHPVFESVPDWSEEPGLEMERYVSIFDNETGAISTDDLTDLSITTQSLRWALSSRAAMNAWRRRIMALRGKQGAFWKSSESVDLVASAGITADSAQLRVRWSGYTEYLDGMCNREDIRIELASGQVFYRRIVTSIELSASEERLTLDSALGVYASAADIVRISFLSLCRFDTDTFDLAFWTGDIADVAATIRSFAHDV